MALKTLLVVKRMDFWNRAFSEKKVHEKYLNFSNFLRPFLLILSTSSTSSCSIFFLDSCTNGLFRCTYSDQCVLNDRTCNGISDCGDSSDERLDAGCSKY